MTPKEKAKEMFDKMKGFRVKHTHSKKCAIKSIDDIIYVISGLEDSVWAKNANDFWNEVKEELQKL
jgi:hypothetical protein